MIKRWMCSLMLVSLAALCGNTAPLTSRDVVPFRIKIVAQRVFPGDIFRVLVQSSKTIQEINASFSNRKVIFYASPDNHEWDALVGVDLETKAGHYFIQGTLRLGDGKSQLFKKELHILPRKFPVQRITVAEKYVTPSPEDAQRAEEEARKMEAIWGRALAEKLWQGPFLKPVSSELTSGFGRRRIVNNQPRSPHSGVDLKAPVGTPITAANSGKVSLAEELFFSGNTVVIDHGLGLYTSYAHCSKILVQEGEPVRKGQVIAEVGATGRVTGPHLHWACRLNGARVNPLNLTSRLLGE